MLLLLCLGCALGIRKTPETVADAGKDIGGSGLDLADIANGMMKARFALLKPAALADQYLKMSEEEIDTLKKSDTVDAHRELLRSARKFLLAETAKPETTEERKGEIRLALTKIDTATKLLQWSFPWLWAAFAVAFLACSFAAYYLLRNYKSHQ